MCGITGMTGSPDANVLRRMTTTLLHRGPDDDGFYYGEGVSLGHRRLSIVDISGGHQPMSSADEKIWLSYNGEIYNFPELREDLEAQGRVFRTHCDTEVVLHAYAVYGDACVEKFQGMFAFALWDVEKGRLLLARDPIGVKPLYYAQSGGELYFASEMKALLQVPAISRALDPESLDDYLTYLYAPPPRTIFTAIRQLPPGHFAVWEHAGFSIHRYWRLKMNPEERSEEEWLETLRPALSETVRKYMLADVPLGAYLSGGLDSSTIVAEMLQASGDCVRTYTIGFGAEGDLYDESREASALAASLDTEHHLLKVHDDLTALLPRVVHQFDEPFGNPTALLSFAISELVRKHVKVVLSGDGGDEIFGGYPRYAGAALAERYRRLPHFLRAGVIAPLAGLLPESTRGAHRFRRIKEFATGSLLNPVDMYATWISHFTGDERHELYGEPLRRALNGRDALDYLRGLAAEAPSEDPVGRAIYIDLHSFLPNNVLAYGDRMSMAHGLETRVPLADPKLVELMARVPSDWKVHAGESKRLLRRAMMKKLPPEVVRRGKIGFNPPMGVWLNTRLRSLVEDYLSPGTVSRRGLFRPDAVQQLISDHRRSRKDNTWRLYALLVLEEWQRQYLD